MLVLSRLEGERIRIQVGTTTIWVTILEASKRRSRIGVEAPKNVLIDREEIAIRRDSPQGEKP